MSITYFEDKRVFSLDTAGTTYQMQIGKGDYLVHLYYGERLEGTAESVYTYNANIYCPEPMDLPPGTLSPNMLMLEYPASGTGDYRTPCIDVIFADGSRALDLRYSAHRIYSGKQPIKGMPSAFAGEKDIQVLEITLKDTVKDFYATLVYSVSEDTDSITRSAYILNKEPEPVVLKSALSCCVDIYGGREYDLVRFMGRALMERELIRTPLTQGKLSSESVQGLSGHSSNPFIILCGKNTGENTGDCMGVMLIYSGNFTASAELEPHGNARITAGIHPSGFSWRLDNGETFRTPEAVISYSGSGFSKLSDNFHRIIREHICRGSYSLKRRPVLLNSWEALIYDFDYDKLMSLADAASDCGIEMLVLDDGWFGKRNTDDCSLGDWVPNEKKLGGTLANLAAGVNERGLKFGLWFEPEMISRDSDLYRANPDWCLQCPGRTPAECRNQLVLDMSRPEVCEYLYNSISAVLSSANIEYVKWDMNRPLTDVYSAKLPPDRQGELYHRYVLGLYGLLDRLTTDFSNVLFEGCASGGGRFDAGMLYYFPQIWCSDNSDAVDRLFIQYNTSFGYPMSAVSAHVSPAKSHQTERSMPLETRWITAMTGAFGYELNVTLLSPEERKEILRQTVFYREYADLFLKGRYCRLNDPNKNDIAAWAYVSENGDTAFVGAVQRHFSPNNCPAVLRLSGLLSGARYNVSEAGRQILTGVTGDVLMKAGITVKYRREEYPATYFIITKEKSVNNE